MASDPFWSRDCHSAFTIVDVFFSVAVNKDQNGEQESIYWSPVASDGDMHDHWSGPSVRLGLPLLAGAYDGGLNLHGDELVALRQEVESLCAHWVEAVSDDEVRTSRFGDRTCDVPLLVHLMNRAECVESAIRLALAINGYLTVS
jgi:hypothetical protein